MRFCIREEVEGNPNHVVCLACKPEDRHIRRRYYIVCLIRRTRAGTGIGRSFRLAERFRNMNRLPTVGIPGDHQTVADRSSQKTFLEMVPGWETAG
jgi:hypothetical protein